MILNRLRLNTLPDSIYLSWVCLKAVLDSAQMDSALSGQRSSWTQRCPCAWLINIFFIFTFLRWCSAPIFLLKTFNVLMNRLKISHFFVWRCLWTLKFLLNFFHIQFTGIILWPLCASKVTQAMFCSPAGARLHAWKSPKSIAKITDRWHNELWQQVRKI